MQKKHCTWCCQQDSLDHLACQWALVLKEEVLGWTCEVRQHVASYPPSVFGGLLASRWITPLQVKVPTINPKASWARFLTCTALCAQWVKKMPVRPAAWFCLLPPLFLPKGSPHRELVLHVSSHPAQSLCQCRYARVKAELDPHPQQVYLHVRNSLPRPLDHTPSSSENLWEHANGKPVPSLQIDSDRYQILLKMHEPHSPMEAKAPCFQQSSK